MGMRQRVAARGGRFDIRRGNPHGTDIRVVLPVASVSVEIQAVPLAEDPQQRNEDAPAGQAPIERS
jgi:hypothetical protein